MFKSEFQNQKPSKQYITQFLQENLKTQSIPFTFDETVEQLKLKLGYSVDQEVDPFFDNWVVEKSLGVAKTNEILAAILEPSKEELLEEVVSDSKETEEAKPKKSKK